MAPLKSTFICPSESEDIVEAEVPLLNGDLLSCPVCQDTHIISDSFSGNPVNRFACLFATKNHFQYVRSDRGAIEFAASTKTPWNPDTRAFTIGDCIFWPSRGAMKNRSTLRHELCHVRQGRKHGWLSYPLQYWMEYLKTGYAQNRYEMSARRAERKPKARR